MSKNAKNWLFIDLSPTKQYYINILNIAGVQVDMERQKGDTINLILAGGEKVKVIGEENFKRLSKVLPFLDIKVDDEVITVSSKSDFFVVK